MPLLRTVRHFSTSTATSDRKDILENPDERQKPWHPLPQLHNPVQQNLRKEIIEELLDIDSPMIMSLAVYCQEYWTAKSNRTQSPGTFEEFIRQRMSHAGAR